VSSGIHAEVRCARDKEIDSQYVSGAAPMDEAKRQLEAIYEEIVDVLATRLKNVWEIVDKQKKESELLKMKLVAAQEPLEELQQQVFTMDLERSQRELIEDIVARLANAVRI